MKTKIFNSQSEIEKYYNEETDTYIFKENNQWLNIGLKFNLDTGSNINACDINACDIKANNINAFDINACDINAYDINACNINACNINACDINANNINAFDINACDIKANNINAFDINACDIVARNINVRNISFYAVCIAYIKLECTSIIGRRKKSIYKCLDNKIVFKKKQHTKQELIDLIGYDFEIVE